LDVTKKKPEIRGHLLDSYHEMSLVLQLDQSLLIRKALGKMLRCPDSVCREALPRINGLEGTSLATTDSKRYQSICGGSSGCAHISHLVQEAALTLDIYQKSKSK